MSHKYAGPMRCDISIKMGGERVLLSVVWCAMRGAEALLSKGLHYCAGAWAGAADSAASICHRC